MLSRTFIGTLTAVLMLAGVSNASAEDAMSAYDFSFKTIDGAPLPMTEFKGKAVLVVNTASECGYKPQYKDLEALWQHYRDRA